MLITRWIKYYSCFSHRHWNTNLFVRPCYCGIFRLQKALRDNCSIHFAQCTSTNDSKTGLEHDATSAMLENWYIVLGFKSLTFTPNMCLVIAAKQLNLCLIWPYNFSSEGIWHFLVSTLSGQCKSCFTVESDTAAVPTVSSSWKAWALVWFLDCFGSNSHKFPLIFFFSISCTYTQTDWTNDFGICIFFS